MTTTINPNTKALHDLGQSLWVDNITREILGDGTLQRYIDELSVTGLTSNPTIFEQAIGAGSLYDAQISELAGRGQSGETLFFGLAMQDLTRAADLFRPIFEATDGVDGWVSLEVSPLIVDDTAATIKAARSLHDTADRPNLFIKIPGTTRRPAPPSRTRSSPACRSTSPCCSPPTQYLRRPRKPTCAGLERRVEAGLSIRMCESVASLFISRWDVAANQQGSGPEMRNTLGMAVSHRRLTRPIAISWRVDRASRSLREFRRTPATAAVRQHRHQGSRQPHDTLYISRRLAAPEHGRTRCRRTHCWHLPITAKWPAPFCRVDGGKVRKR